MTQDHELLQLAQLFDFLEDVVVWVKDRQCRYRWVNQAFILNYEASRPPTGDPENAAQILGKTDYDLSPPFLADQFRLDDEYALRGNRIVNRLELVGQSDGLASWSVTNKIPLFDPSGAVIGTAGMTRLLQASEPGGVFESGLARVLKHMRDHFATPLTNHRLAEVARMSLRAFERKFLACFNQTPQQYLKKLRLRMASRALVFTDQSLVEVAQGCGFSDQSHFTREFRKHFGRTPRHYRAHYLKQALESSVGVSSKKLPAG
jgi:AraC-like DNA-binding protein